MFFTVLIENWLKLFFTRNIICRHCFINDRLCKVLEKCNKNSSTIRAITNHNWNLIERQCINWIARCWWRGWEQMKYVGRNFLLTGRTWCRILNLAIYRWRRATYGRRIFIWLGRRRKQNPNTQEEKLVKIPKFIKDSKQFAVNKFFTSFELTHDTSSLRLKLIQLDLMALIDGFLVACQFSWVTALFEMSQRKREKCKSRMAWIGF